MSYLTLTNELCGQVPGLDIALARILINRTLRDIYDQRTWSFNTGEAVLVAPGILNTGTVAITQYSNPGMVVGDSAAATAWLAAGLTVPITQRQFRVGSGPIYNIVAFNGVDTLTLDRIYTEATVTAAAYSIYKCYYTPPVTNFVRWIDIFNPINVYAFNSVAWTKQEIDFRDPQRGALGIPYYLASYKSLIAAGSIGNPFLVRGSSADPAPTTTGTFIGQSQAIYTIEITTAGAVATAQYKWKRGQGSYTTGIVTAASTDQDLDLGVQVAWPTGTYVLGDVWTITAIPGTMAGVTQYEMWPHPTSATGYMANYETTGALLSNPNDSQPNVIPDVLIMEGAMKLACESMAKAALAKDKPSVAQMWLGMANTHQKTYQFELLKSMKNDEEASLKNFIKYKSRRVGINTGEYMASHDVGDIW